MILIVKLTGIVMKTPFIPNVILIGIVRGIPIVARMVFVMKNTITTGSVTRIAIVRLITTVPSTVFATTCTDD